MGANGVVNVGAVDKSTGKKQSVTVRTSGGLTDADIERMVQEAESMREADNKKKDTVQATNDAETLCYQVEKQLSELKDKMSTGDADELKKKMENLQQVITQGADLEEIKEKTKELQEVSWKVTQQAYNNASSENSAKNDEEKSNDEGKFKEEKK